MSQPPDPAGASAPTIGDRAYSATELPDIRGRLISDLASPEHANLALTVYAMHVRAGLQVLADRTVADPIKQARLLVRHELHRLRDAALYWVSPEMTRLCLAAAPGMPPFRPQPRDLPSAYGLIYFALPLGQYRPWLLPGEVGHSDGTVHALPDGTGGYSVCAATWGPWDDNGRWRGGGTWFTFYTVPTDGDVQDLIVHHGATPQDAARIMDQMPPLRIDNECKIPASARDDAPGADRELALAVADPETTAHWMHQVLAATQLMASERVTRTCDQPLPRGTRRRASRSGVRRPDEPVRLIDLAPATRRPVSEPGQAGTARQYHVRWTVSGHWRNQFHPSAGSHRPVWISSYLKGPADAPLKTGARVNIFRQPGEPTTGEAEPARNPDGVPGAGRRVQAPETDLEL
jgi:hypothetical protein